MLWGVGCQPGISSPVRLYKEQREGVYVLRDKFWGEAKGLEGCYVYVCRVWLCVSDGWVLRSVIRQTRPGEGLTPRNDRAQSTTISFVPWRLGSAHIVSSSSALPLVGLTNHRMRSPE